MKQLIRIGFFISGLLGLLQAQDVHFTQFQRVPLYLNPALTGAEPYAMVSGIDFRQQWRSVGEPFTTYSGFATYRQDLNFDYFGFGIHASVDHSGPGRLQVTRVYLSGAYHFTFNRFELGTGWQAGLAEAHFNDMTYPSQWNGQSGIFDPSLPNGEPPLLSPVTALDLNTGITGKFRAGPVALEGGAAIYHLNRPHMDYYFGQDVSRLPRRTQFHLKADWPLNPGILSPAVLYYRENTAQAFLAGITWQYFWPSGNEPLVLTQGIFWRNNLTGDRQTSLAKTSDALALYTGIAYRQFDLALSYDLNVSSLRTASQFRGAFEISLLFRGKAIQEFSQWVIPCIRF